MSMNVLEASGLGKRYGRTWALRECPLEIPAGHVSALLVQNAGHPRLVELRDINGTTNVATLVYPTGAK